MGRLKDDVIIALAQENNTRIAEVATRPDDTFRVIGTQFNMAATALIAAAPEKKAEILIGKFLDDVKYDIFRNADDIRKQGIPPELRPN